MSLTLTERLDAIERALSDLAKATTAGFQQAADDATDQADELQALERRLANAEDQFDLRANSLLLDRVERLERDHDRLERRVSELEPS